MHNVEVLKNVARRVRRELFEKFVLLQQGHPGSTFSMVDLVVGLYYGGYVRRDPSNPGKFRDRVIISKGHATVVLYPILADLGTIPRDEWENWGRGSSCLRVFGNSSIPGIDATSGSLGHGIGIGAGYALSYRQRESDQRVFVVISEGELYEGSTWESLLFVKHYGLTNLHLIVDRNNLIILGNTETCLGLDPIDEKLRAFGFDCTRSDGHDFPGILSGLDHITNPGSTPKCLLIDTIKGKGLSLMENQAHWHYWNPLTSEQITRCRKDLA